MAAEISGSLADLRRMGAKRTAIDLRELHKQRTIEQIEEYKSSMGLRSFMLEKSVFVEGQTSVLLRNLIGVEPSRKSAPFGNGGKALSFNAKLELLIDIGALNAEDRKLFELFGAIRNQFVHNWKANTMVQCMSFVEKNHHKLWKDRCPKWEVENESDYVEALTGICNDVVTKTLAITAQVVEKLRKTEEEVIHRVMREALIAEVSNVANSTWMEIKRRQIAEEPLSSAEVLDLPIRIAQRICDNVNVACDSFIVNRAESGGLAIERGAPLLKFDVRFERID